MSAGTESLSPDAAQWAYEQQAIAVESVEHNRSAVHVRGCIRCGRTDTMVVYRSGRADEPVCADWKACDERTTELHGLGEWRRKPKPDDGQIHG